MGWCEIDRFAQKSYRALFDTGGEQFYENIRDIDTDGLADFDLKEISRIYEDAELTEQDRLVSLSTCSYEFDNARTVLTGKLVKMEGDMNE